MSALVAQEQWGNLSRMFQMDELALAAGEVPAASGDTRASPLLYSLSIFRYCISIEAIDLYIYCYFLDLQI